ncbi:MAG: hypothetical protein IT454_13160 [Planctomycetes bacterium]|nr:hypothetical protein [Planctomycetota bacterium]
MFNWIYRCRRRMSVIYGRVSPTPLCGRRFELDSAPAALPASATPRPGETTIRGRFVTVRPMPTRITARGDAQP